ncbi:MAG: hypothetical protein IT307_18305 [Chloroflexi bacterium]|nr:hypothetical protein [Chloroflexota bacterium]
MLVTTALLLTIAMGMLGAGVDYGYLVIERSKLQNALDAASLAAAHTLISTSGGGVAAQNAASATATSYMSNMGYSSPGASVNSTFAASPGQSTVDTITVTASVTRNMFFWRAIGINSSTFASSATAVAAGSMVDVMLSLDLTASMKLSGTSDLTALQTAAKDFINQMNPDPASPYGAKVGIARFAGVLCNWKRGTTSNNFGGNGDTWINTGSGTNEYSANCRDDKSVLQTLSFGKSTLVKIANNSGGGTCPATAAYSSVPYPAGSTAVSPWGCPLNSVDYTAIQVTGTPIPGSSISGWKYGSSSASGYTPDYSGTKLPNAVSVLRGPTGAELSDTTCSSPCDPWWAWRTAQGGRNDTTGAAEGYARKVMVMMTDGFDEIYPNEPDPGNPMGDPDNWDTQVVSMANSLKLGPDGVAGTQDDVEIYVVGFFCTPYSTSSSAPNKWCKSRLADTTPPHPCPSTSSWPSGTATAIDTLLKNISSSTSGTCDHYFPIKKTESLPQLFRVIAGSITRGRLSS